MRYSDTVKSKNGSDGKELLKRLIDQTFPKEHKMIKEVQFEESQAELEDDYSDDSLFNISSWGADLSFRELISMYDEEELVKPELQRKYVWSKIEASRFIRGTAFKKLLDFGKRS